MSALKPFGMHRSRSGAAARFNACTATHRAAPPRQPAAQDNPRIAPATE